ncbi:MAG TPA: hypothetical protein VMV94_11370 [Phycisphaerae bacterium]|nr:hypothetical protein [Phycisphaerae bacterium]
MRAPLGLAAVVALLTASAARADFPDFAACLAGPGAPVDPACLAAFDADGDGDVDLFDFAAFQVDYVPPSPTGACCFDNFSCQILTEAECQAAGGGGEWLGAYTACSQCATVRIQRVTYGGSGNQIIKIDCPYPPCTSYSTPQWLDDNHDGDVLDPNDHNYPVAYLRGTSVALSNVRFYVQPGGTLANVPVRGYGPDGLTFTGTGTLAGNYLTVAGTLTSSIALPNTVRYYPSFTINWEVALDGINYYPAGASGSRLYVTYAAPLGDKLESYYYISTPIANGLSAEQAVIDAVWSEFADLEVYNAHGQRLAYYRDVLCASYCTYYYAYELVYYTTSQCGGWADLMIQCLRTQGIDTAVRVTITPRGYPTLPLDCGSPPSSASGFIVKNYNFTLGSFTPCSTYPYKFNDPCGYYGAWPDPSCTDLTGLPGQDNPNPASWFGCHFIVKINLAYYDPSYGAGPFTGTHDEANLAWETAGIAGYWGVAQSSPTRCGVRKDVPQYRETNFDH